MTHICKEIKGSDLVFNKFEDNKVSTKTIIAVTNLSIDIRKLYEYLPITHYHMQPKKRGRKKKSDVVDENKHVQDGAIITAKIENNVRGVDLKKRVKVNKKRAGKYFRNSLTVVMVLHGKTINFKVSRNGKFQMTGCKSDEQAEECIKFCWEYIKDAKDDVWTFTRDNKFHVSFIPAMRNIDFDLGFLIDREKLSRYINIMTEHYSMLESSFGYTGCNIKWPFNQKLEDISVKTLTYQKATDDSNPWLEGSESYVDHLEFISEKEKHKKLTKTRFVTLLIFHSGRTILSSMTFASGKIAYEQFTEIIRKCYDEVREIIIA